MQLVINSAGTYITQKAGLIRVQKSVFLGRLESSRFDELSGKCRDLIDEKNRQRLPVSFLSGGFQKH